MRSFVALWIVAARAVPELRGMQAMASAQPSDLKGMAEAFMKLPADQRMAGMESAFSQMGMSKEEEQGITKAFDMVNGGDISERDVSMVKQFFTPDTPLTNFVSSVDPACLPEKCGKQVEMCRSLDSSCEKRMECMQTDSPRDCWNVKLIDLSNEEGAVLMCAQKEKCLAWGLSGISSAFSSHLEETEQEDAKDGHGIGALPVSLVQTAQGFTFLPQAAIETGSQQDLSAELARRREMHARLTHPDPMDRWSKRKSLDNAEDAAIDSSLLELKKGVDDFNTEVSETPDWADLQRDIGAIATGPKAMDFDGAVQRLDATKQRMQEANQQLQSIKLKLDGAEARRKAHPQAAPGSAATSFLEEPELRDLKQTLGDFIAKVKETDGQREAQVSAQNDKLKRQLSDSERQLDLESKLLSPETRKALAEASSFLEDDEEELPTAIDKDGNITPEAMMVLDQLKDMKLTKSQKLIAMLEGFTEGSNPDQKRNVTDLLNGVQSFLQEVKAHGFMNVIMSAAENNAAFLEKQHPELTKNGGDQAALLEQLSTMTQNGTNLFDSLSFGGPGGAHMGDIVASMGAMAGLGMGGINTTAIFDGPAGGQIKKYMTQLGVGKDSPIVNATAHFFETGQGEEEMDKMFPSQENMIKVAMEMLHDPVVLGQMKSLGFDVPPSMLPIMDKVYEKMLAHGQNEAQMRSAEPAK